MRKSNYFLFYLTGNLLLLLFLFAHAIKREVSIILKEAPEMIIQRSVATHRTVLPERRY